MSRTTFARSSASGPGRQTTSAMPKSLRGAQPAPEGAAGADDGAVADGPRGRDEVFRRERHELVRRCRALFSRKPQSMRIQRVLEDRPREARVTEGLSSLGRVEDPAQRSFAAFAQPVLAVEGELPGDGDELVRRVVGE